MTVFVRFASTSIFFPAEPALVKPLLPALSFIRSKTHWGAAFRFGVVRVPATDFAVIASAMKRSFAADFSGPVALDVSRRVRYVRRDGFGACLDINRPTRCPSLAMVATC